MAKNETLHVDNRYKLRAEIVLNRPGAEWAAMSLLRGSRWFEIMPLPFDNYRVITRSENADVLKKYANMPHFNPNPEEEK